MADVRRLVELGMVPPLAKEVAAQITSGIGNARRLAELSMVPRLAGELATQITAKVGNARRLAELTMVPVLAMEVAGQVGGGVVPPVGPQAVVLPTPSFGSANLLAWWDVSKTFVDSDGVTKPLAFYDDVGFNTSTAIEDASGNGFLVSQGDKSLQPLRGASGGPVTDIAGHILATSKKSLINGLSKITVGMRVKLRSDLAVTGTARTLFYISRSTNTTLIRAAVQLTGGTTGRRVFVDYGVADSATAGDSRSTTAASGPQMPDDVFATLMVELDLSASPCTCSIFLNSTTASYIDSGLAPVTGSAPFAFGASDSLGIAIGDTLAATRPSLCEIPALVVLSDAGNATLRANLKTYLDAAA